MVVVLSFKKPGLLQSPHILLHLSTEIIHVTLVLSDTVHNPVSLILLSLTVKFYLLLFRYTGKVMGGSVPLACVHSFYNNRYTAHVFSSLPASRPGFSY